MRLLLFLLLILQLFSCSSDSKKPEFVLNELHGNAQGTSFSIKFLAKDSIDYSQEVQTILMNIDMKLSTYVSFSIISGFNKNKDSIKGYAQKDSMFTLVYNKSKEIYQLSEGAFNPTVSALVDYWGFANGSQVPEKIDSIKIDSLKNYLTYFGKCTSEIRGDSIYIHTGIENVQFDFNGIAQGASVDVLAVFLEEQGINDYMVELGGEVRAKGKNQEGEIWTIGIDKPLETASHDQLQATLLLENRSLATSGNYRRFYEKDGVKYSHTIDPTTGFPVNHSLLSVSVLADDCMSADAYATVFMVMGLEKSKTFLKNHPELKLDAYFIFSDESGTYDTWMTEGMKKMLTELE